MLAYYWSICKELTDFMQLNKDLEAEFLSYCHQERIEWLETCLSYMKEESGDFKKLIAKLEFAYNRKTLII